MLKMKGYKNYGSKVLTVYHRKDRKYKWDDVEVQLDHVCGGNSRNFEWDDQKRQNLIELIQIDMFHCIHVHTFLATNLPPI